FNICIAYIKELPEYKNLLDLLQKIREDNDVLSLYIGYTDIETMKDLYIVDASDEGKACQPGDFDNVEEEHIQKVLNGDYTFPAYVTNYEEYGWLCSASAPISDENGKVIGMVLVDISMNKILNDRQSFLINIAVIIAIAAAVMLVLILLITDKAIMKPINKLSNAANAYIKNKKENENSEESVFVPLKIKTGDEIENLYKSLMQMEADISSYIKEVTVINAEKERIGAELDVATHIQKSMLPCLFPAFPDRKDFDIYATMDPAKEVGGDFYDFFMVDDRHLAIVMADVSGKGVPAALFMVIAKTLIKDHTQPGVDLGDIFTQVNEMLCESNSEGLFVTAFEGVLDLATGEFNFVNAGHEMPFICKAGGNFEPYKIKAGFVLAGMEGMRYKGGTITLEPGDKIFQYTDGVTEATNAENQLYGMDRLENILNKVKLKKPDEILVEVKKDIDLFVKEAPQFDDITMLCLDYKERMKTDERTDD
ncbi:MAG: SpoIIE family protein phosphatase, partial [Clostridiales bacterium]|nr:SpoIIE family protein phosphatase [Clostridiales bacterium]